MKKFFTIGIVYLIFNTLASGQTAPFKDDDYKKALWMTTRMYGGQRSGENNWYLYDHLPYVLNYDQNAPKVLIDEKYRGKSFIEDSDSGYDLSGGWHDCGDHVKFGQTEFYSAYVLLKGFAEFPEGYDDYYSFDYKGYKESGKWYWEETGHLPDGIPDIVNEVKHATDFFIKCTRDKSTFYYQIGDGDPDHKAWVTSVLKQTMSKENGGQPRTAHKNPDDASMPSFCGATLALMARVYKNYSASYADSCLQHAVLAYEYAKTKKGTIGAPPFYPANKNWKDDYATMCAELYWATGEEKYKAEALSFSIGKSVGQGDVHGNYVFNYSDNGDIALYNLALLGKPGADSILNILVKEYEALVDANGLFQGGDATWGPLRYNANAAWIYALNLKLRKQNNTVPKFIYDNIDYILGKNSMNLSFIVGYGTKWPKFPHHRDIYRGDGGNHEKPGDIPLQNLQSGFMVGGKRNPSQFVDSPTDFTHTEGGIDYQAGLVGALGYINAVRGPVSQDKFKNFQKVEVPTGTQSGLAYEHTISVYPNPSVHNFTVASATKMDVKVYDCLGHLLEQFSTEGDQNIFGGDLLPGVYHMNFEKDGKIVKSLNVVKNW